jgi:hypothetical protein
MNTSDLYGTHIFNDAYIFNQLFLNKWNVSNVVNDTCQNEHPINYSKCNDVSIKMNDTVPAVCVRGLPEVTTRSVRIEVVLKLSLFK